MTQKQLDPEDLIKKEKTEIYHVVCRDCGKETKYLHREAARESARNHRDLFHSGDR